MASPTRNLIDPTGLTRLGPSLWLPTTRPPVVAGQTWVWATQAWFRGDIVTVISSVQIPQIQLGFLPRVPTPPMGHQLVNTFPSIYKERQGIIVGQIYPPPVN